MFGEVLGFLASFFPVRVMLLGAHVSIAGSYLNALTEASRNAMDAIQIFTKNQRYWLEREVTAEEGKTFKKEAKKAGIKKMFSHAIYLISLGSENEEIVAKSILSLAMELKRCETLGLSHTVLHPGSAGVLPVDKAIMRIGDNIQKALALTADCKAKIAIENTAGQGSSIGGKIENIGDLTDYLDSKRIGLCIDTCHAFAAGYDIRTKKETENFLKLVDKKIGLKKLLSFHLNDSKGGLGSRLDRHAHIGEGLLSLEPFEYIMKNFQHIPKVIETPKENEADRRNLTLLRRLSKL
jgi:deoxyribonuclease-4